MAKSLSLQILRVAISCSMHLDTEHLSWADIVVVFTDTCQENIRLGFE
jgi:hypothetical protein